MEKEFAQDQILKHQETSSLFDKNGHAAINSKELGFAVIPLGQSPSQDLLQDMIRTINSDGNGSVDSEEFLNIINKVSSNCCLEDELIEAFQVFDRNEDRFISTAELKHIMNCLGEKLTDQEINEMILEADMDGDGQINYKEFVLLMSGTK